MVSLAHRRWRCHGFKGALEVALVLGCGGELLVVAQRRSEAPGWPWRVYGRLSSFATGGGAAMGHNSPWSEGKDEKWQRWRWKLSRGVAAMAFIAAARARVAL